MQSPQGHYAISLPFRAPGLVKAAMNGRLPRGLGVTRLFDLPPEWTKQHQIRMSSRRLTEDLNRVPANRSPFPGNPFLPAGTKARERPSNSEVTLYRDELQPAQSTIAGQFARSLEILVRTGVRGGPGRNRNSNQAGYELRFPKEGLLAERQL